MLVASIMRVDVSAIPLHLTFTQSKQHCSGKKQLNTTLMLTIEEIYWYVGIAESLFVILSIGVNLLKH